MITETPFTPVERRTVASLALLYSFRMLGLFMVLPLLALYAGDMAGATPALIGLALGIYGLSQALLQIPFGWLSDWIGRKPVILAPTMSFMLAGPPSIARVALTMLEFPGLRLAVPIAALLGLLCTSAWALVLAASKINVS